MEDQLEPDDAEWRSSVDAKVIGGNPTCKDLAGMPYDVMEYKIDGNPKSGVYEDPYFSAQKITLKVDYENYVDFDATNAVHAVVVKGGPKGAHAYYYDPKVHSDKKLSTPGLHDVSHISFCYKPSLTVSKTADTSSERKWTWDIEKKVRDPYDGMLKLAYGQYYKLLYDVIVKATGHTDHKFEVTGKIVIENKTPKKATVEKVIDVITRPDGTDPIYATVDCPKPTPFYVAPYDKVVCSYHAMLPDGSKRKNTAIVKTSGPVDGDSGTAKVEFGAPTHEIDECVKVSDDKTGLYEEACVGKKLEHTFYTHIDYKADKCGDDKVVNVAELKTKDTGTPGSDKAVVHIKVDCDKGCTRTIGFWMTHSYKGPAPRDEGWDKIGADTYFYGTGKTYLEVIKSIPAGGNVCVQYGRQTVGAELNKANGASSTAAVEEALDYAKKWFSQHKLDDCPKSERTKINKYAEVLDKYNNGNIGPGHCDEQEEKEKY